MPYRRPCLQSERKINECSRRIGFLVCRIKPPVLVCQKRRFRPTNPQPFFPAVATGGGRRTGRLARHLARQAGRNHHTRLIFAQPVPQQPGRLRARFGCRLPRAGSPPPARIRRHARRRAAFHTDAADAQRKPRNPHPSRRAVRTLHFRISVGFRIAAQSRHRPLRPLSAPQCRVGSGKHG